MDDTTKLKRLEAIAQALSIGSLNKHIFLCAEPKTPKCAPREESAKTWGYLKKRLKELNLSSNPPVWRGDDQDVVPPVTPGQGCVLRTKVDCLRVCEQGPICVVYPEGIWYHSVTADVMERIISEHLLKNEPVEEYVFARDNLQQ